MGCSCGCKGNDIQHMIRFLKNYAEENENSGKFAADQEAEIARLRDENKVQAVTIGNLQGTVKQWAVDVERQRTRAEQAEQQLASFREDHAEMAVKLDKAEQRNGEEAIALTDAMPELETNERYADMTATEAVIALVSELRASIDLLDRNRGRE